MNEKYLDILRWALSLSQKYWDSLTDNGYFYDWDSEDYWSMTNELARQLGVEQDRICGY